MKEKPEHYITVWSNSLEDLEQKLNQLHAENYELTQYACTYSEESKLYTHHAIMELVLVFEYDSEEERKLMEGN